MDLPPEVGARGQPRAEVAGGRERAATPCFSGLLWGEPQLHSPLPPASVALFQRFTSQLSGGGAAWVSGRHPAPPQSALRSPGPQHRLTPVHASLPPPCRHIHGVCPALCAPSPGRIGGPLGVTVLECSWRHGGLHLYSPPGSPAAAGARAQSGAAAATAFRRSAAGFLHPARSFQDWFARNVLHARSSPGPEGRPAVTPPQRAARGFRGGRRGTDLRWSRGGSLLLRLALPRVPA